MLKQWLAGLMLMTGLIAGGAAQAADGVISLPSAYNVDTTEQRLVNVLEEKGMRVFAQVDHSAGAAGVGLQLRPTRLVIFGNPQVGTLLMQCAQTAALDLPQKALIWEDGEGRVWLSYNDPQYMARRHGIDGCGEALQKIGKALAGFARSATGSDTHVEAGDEIYY